MNSKSNRREFLTRLRDGAAVVAAGVVPLPSHATAHEPEQTAPLQANHRLAKCVTIKKEAAWANARMPEPNCARNNDELVYETKAASYHKGLPHNDLGEVDPSAYRLLLHALNNGHASDFDKIPIGGNLKLSNPQAAFSTN